MKDGSIPVTQVEEIEAELTKYHIPHRIFTYEGADHSFFCDARGSYNRITAENAWKQVLELFAAKLKN